MVFGPFSDGRIWVVYNFKYLILKFFDTQPSRFRPCLLDSLVIPIRACYNLSIME